MNEAELTRRIGPWKGLVLIEPWLQAVIEGKKTLETRSWGTDYRGGLALCASKASLDPVGMAAFYPSKVATPREMTMDWRHPRGVIRATAWLTDCRKGNGSPEEAARAGCPTLGRWVWELEHVAEIAAPIPVRGMLGLFEVHGFHPVYGFV